LNAPQTSLSRYAVRAVLAAGLVVVAASLFVQPRLRLLVDECVAQLEPFAPRLVQWAGWDDPFAWPLRHLAVAAVLALVAVLLDGPRRTGLLSPNTMGWRLCVVATIVTALGWFAFGHAGADQHVLDVVERPFPWQWLAADVALTVAEVVLAHGVVSVFALPFGLPEVDERRRIGVLGLRFLAAFGAGRFENSRLPGPRTVLAIPVETWPAVVAEGAVVALLAWTPSSCGPVAAFLGGVAGAWMTVRCRSVWPVVVVRLVVSPLPFIAFALASTSFATG
jgi:hypothetical protein